MSNTPRLRFPGFTGEWKEKKLGDSFDERTEKNRGDLPLLSLGEEGLVYQSDTARKDNSNADKSKYLRVDIGDIAYNTMRMWQGRCVFAGIEGIVSPAYTVCKPKNGIDSLFHYYLFKTQRMIQLFHQNSQGLVSDTLNLKYEAFSKIRYYLPPTLAEQQKIASCLTEIDNLITAQGQKVDALKEKKKGLMQQLFPQQGETTPKLRFPGFEGEWIEKKLGEVADFQNGYSYNSSTFTDEGDYVIRISDIKDGTISLKSAVRSTTVVSDVFKVVKGDILIAMSGATTGKIGEYRNDNVAYINQRVGNIKPFDINKKLLLFILQSDFFARYLNGILTVGAQPNISSQQICSFGFMLPSSDSEQKQIAECLSELEDLIIFESEKLEALKDHKKGLMQQLFPQPSK